MSLLKFGTQEELLDTLTTSSMHKAASVSQLFCGDSVIKISSADFHHVSGEIGVILNIVDKLGSRYGRNFINNTVCNAIYAYSPSPQKQPSPEEYLNNELDNAGQQNGHLHETNVNGTKPARSEKRAQREDSTDSERDEYDSVEGDDHMIGG